MAVAFDHGEGFVAEDGGDFEGGGAVHGEVGSCCVAEVVEADVDVGFEEGFVPGGSDVGGLGSGDGGKDIGAENNAVLAFCGEDFGDVGCEGDGAGFAVFGVAEGDEVVGEIEIRPVEVEDFATAGSGCEGECDDGKEVGAAAVAAGVEEAGDFV